QVVLLSIESRGLQSRRLYVDLGMTPPKFSPNTSTCVRVDGMRLKTKDGEDTRDPLDEIEHLIGAVDWERITWRTQGRTHAKREKRASVPPVPRQTDQSSVLRWQMVCVRDDREQNQSAVEECVVNPRWDVETGKLQNEVRA